MVKEITAIVCSLFLLVGCSQSPSLVENHAETHSIETKEEMKTNILFINPSQNSEGNTATMAKDLLGDIPYDQVNLIDYRIAFLGQEDDEDEFFELLTLVSPSRYHYYRNTCILAFYERRLEDSD